MRNYRAGTTVLSVCFAAAACGGEQAQADASTAGGASTGIDGAPMGGSSSSRTSGSGSVASSDPASGSVSTSSQVESSGSSGSGTPTVGGDDTSGGTETGGVPKVPLECEGSVLADVVGTMAPGSWAQLPANESLLGLEMSYALLYWADSAVFDPVTRSIRWVGGPGICCANPATYQLVAYDEVENAWSIEPTPFAGAGHSYDGNAFDPTTGDHYFAVSGDPVVHVHDGREWSDLPPLPVFAATTMGMTWFPEMNGMLYVGSLRDLALWSEGEWSVLATPDVDWGTYNVFAEHSPVHGVVFIGGGNGAGNVGYTLAPDGTLTRQPDSPVNLGNGSSHQFADPATGNIVVHHFDTDQWWELDLAAGQWSQIEMAAPGFIGNRFHVPLPHCGVTMFFDHYWENRVIHLYRHGA